MPTYNFQIDCNQYFAYWVSGCFCEEACECFSAFIFMYQYAYFNLVVVSAVRDSQIQMTDTINIISLHFLVYTDDICIIGRSLPDMTKSFTSLDTAARKMSYSEWIKDMTRHDHRSQIHDTSSYSPIQMASVQLWSS